MKHLYFKFFLILWRYHNQQIDYIFKDINPTGPFQKIFKFWLMIQSLQSLGMHKSLNQSIDNDGITW